MNGVLSPPIDLMIIGAQKSGTTSLLHYLGEHPEVCAHPQKEFAYFLEPAEYSQRYDKAFAKYYPHYDRTVHKAIVGKSASLYSETEALLRLKGHNPHCRIVIILRNPIERTYSSFLMEKNAGNAPMSFPELLTGLKNNKYPDLRYILEYSCYATHLENIYSIFPKEQVSVFFYEELKFKAGYVCKQLFGLLGVNRDFTPNVSIIHNPTNKIRSDSFAKIIMTFFKKGNVIRRGVRKIVPDSKAYKLGDMMRKTIISTDKYPEMDNETRMSLRSYFSGEISRLQDLTGMDLSDWLESGNLISKIPIHKDSGLKNNFPKITIITPSFNQGEFLEDTIRSVLAQEYPNLEYFIIDGGSTDRSVEIIKKYAPQLSWWVSEKDHGQSEAINKGLKRATGDVIAWLNSDDLYMPGALHEAARLYINNPDAGLINGDTILINRKGQEVIKRTDTHDLELRYFSIMPFAQPSSFFTRKAYLATGNLEESLHFGMDYDHLIRIALRFPIVHTDFVFSKYRLHDSSKTVTKMIEFAWDWQGVFSALLRSIPNAEFMIAKLREAGIYIEGDKTFSHDRKFSKDEIRKITCFFLEYQMHLYYQLLKMEETKHIGSVIKNIDPEFFKAYKLDKIGLRATLLPVPFIRTLRTITR